MTITDRSDADDATWQAELARIEAAPAVDEDCVERVARVLYEQYHEPFAPFEGGKDLWLRASNQNEWRDLARAAIAALKPAPGTDSSGQAVQ